MRAHSLPPFAPLQEGKTVLIELKNSLQIRGTLASVDHYLNMKIDNVEVVDRESFPQLLSVKSLFVRGGVVRYVHLPADAVDTELLQDAARKEAMEAARAGSKR